MAEWNVDYIQLAEDVHNPEYYTSGIPASSFKSNRVHLHRYQPATNFLRL